MFEDNPDGWQQSKKTREETQAGAWLRLKNDGDSAIACFPVPPFAYRQVWVDGGSEIYDPKEHDGMRPSGRFAFSVFTQAGDDYVPQVFDASGEAFDLIAKVVEKYGTKYLFEITRNGTGKDTKYQILPERKLKKSEIAKLSEMDLLDAEKLTLGGSHDDEDDDVVIGENPFDGYDDDEEEEDED